MQKAGSEVTSAENLDAVKERDELRREREKEIQKQMRTSNRASEKPQQNGIGGRAFAERDVSEKVALGMAIASSSRETMYDQRLFNQNEGVASGFKEDDGLGV